MSPPWYAGKSCVAEPLWQQCRLHKGCSFTRAKDRAHFKQCHEILGGLNCKHDIMCTMHVECQVWPPRRLYDDNIALYGKRYYYYIWELPVFVLMGVLAGLLGALFIQLNIRVTALRARWVPPRRPHLRLLEVRAPGTCSCARCMHAGAYYAGMVMCSLHDYQRLHAA